MEALAIPLDLHWQCPAELKKSCIVVGGGFQQNCYMYCCDLCLLDIMCNVQLRVFRVHSSRFRPACALYAAWILFYVLSYTSKFVSAVCGLSIRVCLCILAYGSTGHLPLYRPLALVAIVIVKVGPDHSYIPYPLVRSPMSGAIEYGFLYLTCRVACNL